MIFDYNLQKAFMSQLQLDDIGYFGIRCSTFNNNLEYYVVAVSVMGKTAIYKFGPLIPDCERLPNGFNLSYKIISYKESTLAKEITKFINDPQHEIVNIEEISVQEALSMIPTQEMFAASLN